MRARLLLIAAALMAASFASAYGQSNNETSDANQPKLAEQKQGGEYSGFENTQKQSEGIPKSDANPTPQAPISGLDVQVENKTTTTAAATASETQQSPFGIALLAGMGAVAAVAIGAGVWYFRKKNKP